MITDRKLTIAVSGMKKLEKDNGTIGICDLVFSNLFVIRCVRIERKEDGYTMLRFPYRVAEYLLGCQTRLLDVCHPLTGQFRQELTELVLQEWNAKFADETEAKAQS